MNLSTYESLNLSSTGVQKEDVSLSVTHFDVCSCSVCCSITADFSSDGSVVEEDFTLQSETFRWQQPQGKGSPITLKYSFTNLFDGGLKGSINNAQMKAAVEESFRLWSTYAPLQFVEVKDSGVKSRNNPNGADIRIGHDTLDQKGGTLGRTRLTYDGQLATTVLFDSQDLWASDRTATESDFLYVAAHEIGHALGLRHELTNDALMRASTRDVYEGLGSAFLYKDDIEGIQALFGAGAGSVTPLSGGPTPPNEPKPPTSNPPTPKPPTSNPPAPKPTGDALVVGTEGRDTLRGNDLNQTLRARGGSDTVFAGAGDDLVRGGLGVDTIAGEAGDDSLWGDGGRDYLIGGLGDDRLVGGMGNDRLVGVETSVAKPGLNEKDVLIGGSDRDLFALGDSNKVYYDDGQSGSVGLGDYAEIRDFNSRQGDKIQLKGSVEDYRIGSAPAGAAQGRGIFYLNAGEDELIAVVRNNNKLTLESSSFTFV